MSKNKPANLAPSESVEEFIEYFDIHDMGDSWEQMPNAHFEVDIKRRKQTASKRTKKHKLNLIEQLEAEYKNIRPLAERFCLELSSQINELIRGQQITLAYPVESRVKRWESVLEKLEHSSLRVDSIESINDLVGLRIIVLSKRDLPHISELITSTFKLLGQYEAPQQAEQNPSMNLGSHFWISMPETWLTVPTLRPMADLKAEIQVRTVVQQTWAALSHSLQYKSIDSVPQQMRRTIFRLSALLEVADSEFQRILEERDDYRKDLNALSTEERLNVDLVEKILDELLPLVNKENNEAYADLLKDLLHFNIDSRQMLKDLINRNRSQALDDDSEKVSEVLESIKKAGTSPETYGVTAKRLEEGVFYSHVGLVRRALKAEFGHRYTEYKEQNVVSFNNA